MGVKVRNIDYVRTAKENCFVLNGVSSLDFGIVVTDGEDFFKSAERDTDSYEVPGRNGEVSVDNGRYKNVDMTITCAIEYDFRDQFIAFKNYVGKQRGYVRLENTYDPEIYQMAKVVSIKPKTLGTRYHAGTFEIKFDAMPQKFLKGGEQAICYFAGAIEENAAGSGVSGITSGFITTTGNKTATITVHCPANVTVRLDTSTIGPPEDPEDPDSPPVGSTSTDYLTNGQTVTKDISYEGTTYATFELMLENGGSLNNISASIITQALIEGETVEINAVMAKSHTIQNPTGFISRPLIEYYDLNISDLKITNYLDGVAEEYFELASSGNASDPHIFVDCDNQYIYDSDGTNLSTGLQIITAQDRKGRNLVFPRFGTDEIVFALSRDVGQAANENPALIYIYPRWWRL